MNTMNHQLIIFEGPDGSGKTTAVNEIASILDAYVFHHGPYPSEDIITHHYIDSMIPILSNTGNVILDRSWYSEIIYGTVFRDGMNRINAEHFDLLKRCAKLCNPVIVVCMPPMNVCVENYQKRKKLEYLDNEEQLKKVWFMYNQIRSSDIPVIKYDYTTQLFDDLINKISTIFNHQTKDTQHGN